LKCFLRKDFNSFLNGSTDGDDSRHVGELVPQLWATNGKSMSACLLNDGVLALGTENSCSSVEECRFLMEGFMLSKSERYGRASWWIHLKVRKSTLYLIHCSYRQLV
jgi:hypothetical protein